MKRALLTFGLILTLFLFGCSTTSNPQSNGGPDSGVVTPADSGTSDPTTLPALPSLSGASGIGGGGMGGGGGGGEGMGDIVKEGYPDSFTSDRMMIWNPFENTTFTLNGTLPIEIPAVPVYQQAMSNFYSLDDVARLAALFGFEGPIYTETYPTFEDSNWTPPVTYILFDGRRQLSVSDAYFYYSDWGLSSDGDIQIMPAAQAGPIAEAFLRERGLLDFPYEMVSPYGQDLEFRRIADGRALLFPEFHVTVDQNGRVVSVSHTPLSQLAPLGSYPLRSAEAAWQLIQTEGIDYQRISYMTRLNETVAPVVEPDRSELYRHWQRTYTDGDPITIHPYLAVYTAARNDAPPRIMVEQYLLQAAAADLEAIAREIGKQITVQGIIRQTAEGLALELVEWSAETNQEYAFLEGMIQRNGEQVILVNADGRSYLIPDAPADLPHGEQAYVNGWLSAETEAGYPVFNWQGMGLLTEESVHQPIEGIDEYQPYQISTVNMTNIDLIYMVNSIYDESSDSSSFLVQPVWRFTGTTNNENEIIEMYVQAVDDAYLQPTTP